MYHGKAEYLPWGLLGEPALCRLCGSCCERLGEIMRRVVARLSIAAAGLAMLGAMSSAQAALVVNAKFTMPDVEDADFTLNDESTPIPVPGWSLVTTVSGDGFVSGG